MYFILYLYLQNAGHKLALTLLAHPEKVITKNMYVDYFSKYVEAKSVESETGSGVGAFLYEHICKYGVMDITIMDQGTC